MNPIEEILLYSIDLHKKILSDPAFHQNMNRMIDLVVKALGEGRKLLLCGNGGSAADAQHIAAEFSGRFYKNRPPLFAEALHVNTSYITAVSNDYGFEYIYERQVEAQGKAGDVLIGISTSGTSTNVIKAMQKAQKLNMHTIAFTGENKATPLCKEADIILSVPSNNTPRIQEIHILMGHILCQQVEHRLFHSSDL